MNTDININKEDVKRARYNLAPASHRIFARILDFILMSLLSLGFAALIFLTDPNFKGTISGFQVREPFRYFLFGITASVTFFAYFVILPYFLTNSSNNYALPPIIYSMSNQQINFYK